MRKVKLCIAGLLLSGISFGQCTTNPVEEECKILQYTIADLVDAVKMDIYYGKITKEVGSYYLGELNKLQITRMYLVNTINKSQLAFDEEVSDYLQETLTVEEWDELEARTQ